MKIKIPKIEQSILITRPKDLAIITAKNLQKLGYQTIIEPIFTVKTIHNWSKNVINQETLQAVIISSANAINALQELKLANDLPILAIGKKTASKIKKIGYKKIFYANNSARSLLEIAQKKFSPFQGKIIYLSGKIITLDLAQELNLLGYEAQRIAVYETIPKKELSKKLINKLKNHLISKVLIYSKNTATIFYHLISKYDLLENFEQIELSCLSKQIADHCLNLGFKKIGLIENINKNDYRNKR